MCCGFRAGQNRTHENEDEEDKFQLAVTINLEWLKEDILVQ